MTLMYRRFTVLLVVCGLFVVACAPTPVAVAPTDAAPPTLIPVSPTLMPVSTNVPSSSAQEQTATPGVPTATATQTSMPTATIEATTAPSATAVVTATAMISATATTAPVSTNVPSSSAEEETATPSAGDSGSPTTASGSTNSNLAFLPPGEGQQILLNNCSNCHSFICAVIGQRSQEHLESVKATHRERVSNLTDEELNTLFAYLYENFGDQKPVPVIPEVFAGQGCTAQ